MYFSLTPSFTSTEDFQLNINPGEFTDSEILVMLGENGEFTDVMQVRHKQNQNQTYLLLIRGIPKRWTMSVGQTTLYFIKEVENTPFEWHRM